MKQRVLNIELNVTCDYDGKQMNIISDKNWFSSGNQSKTFDGTQQKQKEIIGIKWKLTMVEMLWDNISGKNDIGDRKQRNLLMEFNKKSMQILILNGMWLNNGYQSRYYKWQL